MAIGRTSRFIFTPPPTENTSVLREPGYAQMRTRAQIQLNDYDQTRDEDRSMYSVYRKMRADPTIGIARDLVMALILMEPWTVSGEMEYVNNALREYVLPFRKLILQTAAYAQLDFGWKAYETFWDTEVTSRFGTVFVPKVIKPLLNDYTWQRRDPETNEFIGLRHDDIELGIAYWIDANHSLFINFDEEGVGKYGMPLQERARGPYTSWNKANDAAVRYDDKVAGAFVVVRYPVGSTPLNGVETDNKDIADAILDSLQASGAVTIPQKSLDDIDALNGGMQEAPWGIEVISGQGTGAIFNERMRYLDSLKVRSYGVTERSILEGQFGTKAEAGEHADLAMSLAHMRHERIVDSVNEQLVKLFLKVNFGDDYINAAAIEVPSPDAEAQTRLMQVYMSLLTSPDTVDEEVDHIDRAALRDMLGVPVVTAEGSDALVNDEGNDLGDLDLDSDDLEEMETPSFIE